jgi:hypothetical protein
MRNIAPISLSAAAIIAISVGTVSAMPANGLAGVGPTYVHEARMVCDRYQRCYNRTGAYRARPYYAQRYYGGAGYGYGGPGYAYGGPGYGYYGAPAVGIGVGPLGIRIF